MYNTQYHKPAVFAKTYRYIFLCRHYRPVILGMGPVSMWYKNSNMAPRLRGLIQKKLFIDTSTEMQCLSFKISKLAYYCPVKPSNHRLAGHTKGYTRLILWTHCRPMMILGNHCRVYIDPQSVQRTTATHSFAQISDLHSSAMRAKDYSNIAPWHL